MKRISGYLIGVVFIIGVFTIIGRWLDIEFFKRSFAHNETMNPVTALSLIAASGSFFLLCKIKTGKNGMVLGRVLALFVLSVGLLKLLALTGIDIDVNHWLVKEDFIGNEKQSGPVTLAIINSSYGFLITGISLLLTGRKGKWPGVVINYLALSGFIIGTFVCIGFIYHVNEFYGLLPYMSVAPATAVCFLCFSLGMLFENSQSGFMAVISSRHLGGNVARPLIPIGIGVPFVFGYIGLYLAGRIPFSIALGVAILNIGIVVVFLVVLWFLARVLNNLDIERKRAQSQLELQAQLFNILPDAVVYGNKDLSITQMNPAAKQIFEVGEGPTDHLILDDLFKIEITELGRDAVRKDLWGERGFWRGESNLITRSGKKMQAMVLLQAIKNEEGEKVAWFGVYTDIGFLRLNEELKAANNYLEQLAFISAHDIKSPILTLQGLVDLMYRSENIKPEQLQLLGMQKNVIRQMEQTNNALNEILKLRKNLKVKDIRESETLALDKIMSNIIGLLETEVGLSGARFEMEISEVSETLFPRVYFQSLFYNLIYNSIKYRDTERPLVIKFTGRKMDGKTVQFAIEDNGIGFDLAHNKHRIFGIFKRFHNHVEGTGVGLHIVKSIVDAFDGSIEVDSQPGVGTRFELIFKTANLS